MIRFLPPSHTHPPAHLCSAAAQNRAPSPHVTHIFRAPLGGDPAQQNLSSIWGRGSCLRPQLCGRSALWGWLDPPLPQMAEAFCSAQTSTFSVMVDFTLQKLLYSISAAIFTSSLRLLFPSSFLYPLHSAVPRPSSTPPPRRSPLCFPPLLTRPFSASCRPVL